MTLSAHMPPHLHICILSKPPKIRLTILLQRSHNCAHPAPAAQSQFPTCDTNPSLCQHSLTNPIPAVHSAHPSCTSAHARRESQRARRQKNATR